MIVPEPICDLRAQLQALADPSHPKRCVFVAAGTAYVVIREAGTLITKDLAIAELFRTTPQITDTIMAAILGYPEDKNGTVNPVVVQACDRAGSVITEAAASASHVDATVTALLPHGLIRIVSVEDALVRRMELG